MRKIYAIEFLERDGEEKAVAFTKPLPNIPVDGNIKTRKGLERKLMKSDLSDLDKLVTMTGIAFAIDQWFPKLFYRIVKIDWQFD